MRVDGAEVWEYRMHAESDATVYNSCFAVYLLHLFNALDLSDADRSGWIAYLQGLQDPTTGIFSDPSLVQRPAVRDRAHADWQLTTLCLAALDILGGNPLHPFSFLEPWYDPEYLASWMAALDWRNPWHSGNKVMFVGVLLAFVNSRTASDKANRALQTWFDWLDGHQNPDTGFWGEGGNAPYYAGMGGAYHEYLVYNYVERAINHSDKIVDRVLLLQQADGLFVPPRGGGSCDDFDAVDILSHNYHGHDYRRADIRLSLERALQGLLRTQNDDGGFGWASPYELGSMDYWRATSDLFRLRDLRLWAWNLRRTLRDQRAVAQAFPIQTVWNTEPRLRSTSSVFDTWLRCAAIAEVSTVLTESPYAQMDWQFMDAPGVGWFRWGREIAHQTPGSEVDHRCVSVEVGSRAPALPSDPKSLNP